MTDITIRWRQMGWVPPSELPAYREKWDQMKSNDYFSLMQELAVARMNIREINRRISRLEEINEDND